MVNENRMFTPQAGSPSTELSAGIAAGDEAISVVDVSILPEAPNILTMVDGEDFETVIYEEKMETGYEYESDYVVYPDGVFNINHTGADEPTIAERKNGYIELKSWGENGSDGDSETATYKFTLDLTNTEKIIYEMYAIDEAGGDNQEIWIGGTTGDKIVDGVGGEDADLSGYTGEHEIVFSGYSTYNSTSGYDGVRIDSIKFEDGNGEIIEYVTAEYDNDLMDVTRGVEGQAQSWTAGQEISRLLSAKDLLDIQLNIDTLFDRPQIAVARVSDLNATAALFSGKITIEWINPDDLKVETTTDNLVTVSRFDKVKVVRKEGGIPENPDDGTLVYEGGGEQYTDTGVDGTTEYFYSVFAYSEYGHYENYETVSDILNKVIYEENPELESIINIDWLEVLIDTEYTIQDENNNTVEGADITYQDYSGQEFVKTTDVNGVALLENLRVDEDYEIYIEHQNEVTKVIEHITEQEAINVNWDTIYQDINLLAGGSYRNKLESPVLGSDLADIEWEEPTV